ncbi:MAG: RDD family protein [Holophagaceae bacterium]
MVHDADNPFAPPSAPLVEAPPEADGTPASAPPMPASPAHRLTAAVVGIALGYAATLASMITGELLAERLGIAARFTAWEPLDYAAGAAGLAVYAPFALRRLARSGQTLPLRLLGLRFARPEGEPVEAWRILLFHGLPTAALFWGPVLAASALRLGGPLDGLLRFSGLIALCTNALSAARASRRTWLDAVGGLAVVKA